MGEEAVLADSGRVGEIASRVGRVKRLACLIIMQKSSSLVRHVQALEILTCPNRFAAAC